MFEEDLFSLYMQIYQDSVQMFEKSALGDDTSQFLQKLQKQTESLYELIKAQNAENSSRLISTFVQSNFSEVEKKLRAEQFESYNQFETEVFHYQTFCFENAPMGPTRKELILEFCAQAKS